MRHNRAKSDCFTIPCTSSTSTQKGEPGRDAPEAVAGSGSAANGEQDLGLDCDRTHPGAMTDPTRKLSVSEKKKGHPVLRTADRVDPRHHRRNESRFGA